MTQRWGLVGAVSRDFLTYGGRVLWHNNRRELEFLVPDTRVMELPPDLPPDQCLPIREHPDFASTRFPLRREDFRR